MSDKVRTEFWGGQLDDVMTEIAREALICNVRVLDPGVIEAVLHNNESVCGTPNPIAFKKLRELLMMLAVMRGKAFDRLGVAEADVLIKSIRDRLKERFGDRLGGTSAPA